MAASRLLLFGGQGSRSIFSSNAAKTAQQDAQSTAGSIFLSSCHAAFLQELSSLDRQPYQSLAIDTASFNSPNRLLNPLERYHTHPVLQATTIYMCQMLRYLTDISQQSRTFEQCFGRIEATAGFSSGIIPAAVVARSSSLNEFLSCGVEGFRLAFWVAYHSMQWTHLHVGNDRGKASEEATMSLVTRGLSREQVEQRLLEVKTYQGFQRMAISSIAISGSVSISGPNTELKVLQEKLEPIPGVTTTFAYVHGWYHGGHQLEPVVKQVHETLIRRNITFPSVDQPSKPIYSTEDGVKFDESSESSEKLLLWLTRHLLVHCVDWHHTNQAIVTDIRSILQQTKTTALDIVSFGPSSASLFPVINPEELGIRLIDASPFKSSNKASMHPSDRPNDIAIVGMSVKLPKGQDTDQLWDTLSQGLNVVQEIPESRFELSNYHTDEVDKPRSMATGHGAFLDDPFSFDNSFFNISPREAKSMDPQQRVLLHAAQEALEDAGFVADATASSQRETTGCYIGLATGDYTDNLRDDIDTFYPSGTLRAFHSGRISYFYRLSGPSVVTDTACSSSTVSIYQACRAIQNGDCTTAIAGGVNVITSPDMYLGLSRGHFLSPTGNCKPFDAGADGYCRAEGCVLFVLKRLSDAVAEGDRIHGVIRNTQINQSGNSCSITHPHSPTQTDLLQRLLKQANVDPGTVSVVEAHGTGTQAGDAREIETLKLVFGQSHASKNPLIVSSIKGNIGHCEAASGAAGLAKLLLMLRKSEIPRQAGLSTINPALGDLQSSGLVIPRHNLPWSWSRGAPRRAVLNNFGAAGSNASLLLEEWLGSPIDHNKKGDDGKRSYYVFTVSAKSNKALQISVDQHIKFLQTRERDASLENVCYTATARRQHYDHRISIACSSEADLITKLEQSRAAVTRPAHKISSTVFVFTGQGALYSGMGQELMTTYPPFRDIIESCDRVIQDLSLGCPSILNYILPIGDAELKSLTHTGQLMASQCACVALEYALAKMFMSWGVKPDYVMGHSLGEYVALCVSSVLTLKDTFRIIATRAKMMGDNCLADESGMLACHIPAEGIQAIMFQESSFSQLSIACLNGPQDCVVGGPLTQLEALQTRFKSLNMKSKLINVPYAFHTSAMEPIVDPLRALERSIEFHDAKIPVISNVDGQLFSRDTAENYIATHTRQPVQFHAGILALKDSIGEAGLDDSLFIEIGPHPALISMLRDSITSTSCTYLSTLHRGRDAWTSLSQTLSSIASSKMTVNWREIFLGTSRQVVSLPGHPLQGTKFFVPFKEYTRSTEAMDATVSSDPCRVKTGHSILPWLRTDTVSSNDRVFETDMGTLGPLISGHDVGGTPICPASVFHELALEASEPLLKPSKEESLVVSGMAFSSPLVQSPSSSPDTTVRVRISKQSGTVGSTTFRIVSCSITTASKEILHCSGHVSTQRLDRKSGLWARDHALVTRQARYFSSAGKDMLSTFRTKLLYENVFTRVVRYSQEYQTLKYLDVADSNLEGMGSFKLPPHEPTSPDGYLAHPVFTDTLLHAAGFIANLAIGSKEIGICSGVDSIEVAYHDINLQDTFTIYCNLLEVKGAIVADSIALDSSEKVVAVIRGMEFKKLSLSTFQQALSRVSSGAGPQSREHIQPTHRATMQKVSTPQVKPEDHPNSNIVSESLTPREKGMSQILRDIVVEVGGFTEQDIDYTMSLADLGIDSMMQIEIASKISRLFPGQTGIDHRALSECETLEEMDDMLSSVLEAVANQSTASQTSTSSHVTGIITPASSESSRTAGDMSGSQVLPVSLYSSGVSPTPLCLFHDGSGQIGMYKRLRGHDRTTYAFYDPKLQSFGGNRSFYHSIGEMAEDYASRLLGNTQSSTFTLILGGWSFGGVVAFEVARILINHGIDVKGLVLIDSPSPVHHEPLPNKIIASITRSTGQTGSTNALEEEFLSNASLLGSYSPESLSRSTGKTLKTVILRSQDTLDTEALCGIRYDWLSRQDTRDAAITDWEALVGGPVHVLPIAGNHFEPFVDDKIVQTAEQLWKACQYIEES